MYICVDIHVIYVYICVHIYTYFLFYLLVSLSKHSIELGVLISEAMPPQGL